MGIMKSGKRTQQRSKTTAVRVTVIVLLVVAGILYLLADRYLIEHVEIADVNAYASAVTQVQSASSEENSSGISPNLTTAGETQSAQDAQAAMGTAEVVEASPTVYSDDWNYSDGEVSIAITQVTSGSGNNKVTWFVADVVLSDATQLQNAFAEDTFGRNIVAYTSEIARENGAIFAVNGDYYGFRTDGIVIRNGVIYRDDPARQGLVFYTDGSMQVYGETETTAQELLDAGAWNTLSFGPALIENSVIAKDLGWVEIDQNLGNHPIQGNQPRTGIGIIDENHFVFIVVDGRSTGYSRGVTLTEFAQIFQELGCTDAYNLDGGGSATMYFMGGVVNNPLGRGRERGTSDILYVSE